jgi:hypothetical protein
MRSSNLIIVAVFGILLAAPGCGGGSGGGGGATAATVPGSVSVVADVSSIRRTQDVSEAGHSVVITFAIARLPSVTALWVRLATTRPLIHSTEAFPVGESWHVTIHLTAPGALVPGTHMGFVRFEVCFDSDCAEHVHGSPIFIPVELVVTALPPVTVTASPPAVVAREKQRPGDLSHPTANVTLTFDPAPAAMPLIMQSMDATPPFVNDTTTSFTSATIAEMEVSLVRPTALAVGHYSGSLELRFCYTTSLCVNEMTALPLTIPVTYTVEAPEPIPEPGVDPLIPAWVAPLPHDVIDAEYSKALDSIVMVSAYPHNALYVYGIDSDSALQVPLDAMPTAVSISPDGLTAAVGHDGHVTHVDLVQAGSPDATSILLNVSAKVFDIVLDGLGYVHVFPDAYGHADVHSIAISTNTEYIGAGLVHTGERAKLHPSGEYIYGATNGLSPSDLEKFGIAAVPVTRLHNSPYRGDYPICGDLWISDSGEEIYTACGHVFRASAIQSDDMLHAGTLPLFESVDTPHYIIRSLSRSDARSEILLIEEVIDQCRPHAGDPLLCRTHLATHDSDSLIRTSVYSFAPLTVAGTNYAQRGMFVFHSTDGTRRFAISQLYGMLTPDLEYHLSEF